MMVSYFETARYIAPQPSPSEWPVPPGVYDPDAGVRAYEAMVERLRYVEELGFDWVSVSEHHYSPRILTPNPNLSAAFLAAPRGTRPDRQPRYGHQASRGLSRRGHRSAVPKPGDDIDALMDLLELFGKKVLPRIRDV
jgi:hypothetical protein